jgi:methionyl-tRNA formyltransferase
VWTPRTLLITDPNLGEAAHARVAAVCADLTWVSWRVSEPEARARLLDRIASDSWDLAISFYSDLVLTRDALGAIALPLNIHPSLPRLRGMGYDLIPLIENHPTVGATLHLMEREVDSGEIFHVHEAPVPRDRTHASLRAHNQGLSLQMLDMLCALMAEAQSLQCLGERLREHGARHGHSWGEDYYSRQTVAMLRDLHGETVGEVGWGTRIRT